MGGFGSGRWGGRAPVESALRLDIGEMFRDGVLRRGTNHASGMTWTSSFTGEQVGELALVANLADSDPTIRFVHRTGRGVMVDYVVELTSTRQRLGGVRWWFLCPLTGERVGTLVLPQGAARFGSRAAYRLAYRSQRSSPRDRAIARMHRMKRRLGAEPSDTGPLVRPLGMHRRTFERKLAELRAAEGSAYGYLRASVEALCRRIDPSAHRAQS